MGYEYNVSTTIVVLCSTVSTRNMNVYHCFTDEFCVVNNILYDIRSLYPITIFILFCVIRLFALRVESVSIPDIVKGVRIILVEKKNRDNIDLRVILFLNSHTLRVVFLVKKQTHFKM